MDGLGRTAPGYGPGESGFESLDEHVVVAITISVWFAPVIAATHRGVYTDVGYVRADMARWWVEALGVADSVDDLQAALDAATGYDRVHHEAVGHHLSVELMVQPDLLRVVGPRRFAVLVAAVPCVVAVEKPVPFAATVWRLEWDANNADTILYPDAPVP